MVSCEKRLFSVLFAIFKTFCQELFLSSDREVRSKHFQAALVIFESNFTSKDVCISSESLSIAAKQRRKFWAEVSKMCLLFSALYVREPFFLAFCFPKLPISFKISGYVVYTECLAQFYPIGTIQIFFIPFPIRIYFYPDSYAMDIRFTPAHDQCKREAYLD